MKLRNLFEQQALTNDQIKQLLNDHLCLIYSPGNDYYHIITDLPRTITDQQYEQLLHKTFTKGEIEVLRDMHHEQLLFSFPPRRFPVGQLDWVLGTGGRSRFTVYTWRQWTQETREWIKEMTGEDDFTDDSDSLHENTTHVEDEPQILHGDQAIKALQQYGSTQLTILYDSGNLWIVQDVPALTKDQFYQLMEVTFPNEEEQSMMFDVNIYVYRTADQYLQSCKNHQQEPRVFIRPWKKQVEADRRWLKHHLADDFNEDELHENENALGGPIVYRGRAAREKIEQLSSKNLAVLYNDEYIWFVEDLPPVSKDQFNQLLSKTFPTRFLRACQYLYKMIPDVPKTVMDLTDQGNWTPEVFIRPWKKQTQDDKRGFDENESDDFEDDI